MITTKAQRTTASELRTQSFPTNGPSGHTSAVSKIFASHLERLALVYVRQSTPQQVFEHKESQARQYALADHAVRLGWSRERVLVIDEDQGHSGQSMDGRSGFKHLLGEVTLDHVGIVLGLEMSRLARSNVIGYRGQAV